MLRQLTAAGLLLFCLPVQAQQSTVTLSRTYLPSTKDLDRLNLTMAWRAYLPTSNRTDGIALVQNIDHQVFVQTRSNILVCFRASTGEEEWRVEMPKRDLPVFPVGINHELV